MGVSLSAAFILKMSKNTTLQYKLFYLISIFNIYSKVRFTNEIKKNKNQNQTTFYIDCTHTRTPETSTEVRSRPRWCLRPPCPAGQASDSLTLWSRRSGSKLFSELWETCGTDTGRRRSPAGRPGIKHRTRWVQVLTLNTDKHKWWRGGGGGGATYSVQRKLLWRVSVFALQSDSDDITAVTFCVFILGCHDDALCTETRGNTQSSFWCSSVHTHTHTQ